VHSGVGKSLFCGAQERRPGVVDGSTGDALRKLDVLHSKSARANSCTTTGGASKVKNIILEHLQDQLLADGREFMGSVTIDGSVRVSNLIRGAGETLI
jgi:hypothetical protein